MGALLLVSGLIAFAAITSARVSKYNDQGMITADKVFALTPPKPYPVVDVHTHLEATPRAYDIAVRVMDAAGLAASVNLSGASGKDLDRHLALAAKYPRRFITFCGIDVKGRQWKARDVGEQMAQSLQRSHEQGAAGFGEVVNWDPRHIAWDDERLEPMWAKLEELRMPINWHVGEPSRRWRPEGPFNTIEAASLRGKGPLKMELLNRQERVLQRHPKLVVIAAHTNFLVDMLPLLVYRFEKYPNYHVDLCAAFEEFGRVPEEFVDICAAYSDRLFYGTDAVFWARHIQGNKADLVAHYKAFHLAHFLFLGTRQRMIPVPFSGNYGRYFLGWENGFTRYAHDGVALSDAILRKMYYRNAEKLFGLKVEGRKPPKGLSFETPFAVRKP
jgi:uncharacterized protein